MAVGWTSMTDSILAFYTSIYAVGSPPIIMRLLVKLGFYRDVEDVLVINLQWAFNLELIALSDYTTGLELSDCTI